MRALVAKGHKNTNAPLIFENLGHYFFLVLGKLHNGPLYHRERILKTSTLSCNEEKEEITKPPTR